MVLHTCILTICLQHGSCISTTTTHLTAQTAASSTASDWKSAVTLTALSTSEPQKLITPPLHPRRLTAAAGPSSKSSEGALIAYTPGQGPAAAAAAAPGGVAAAQQQKAIMAVINDKGKGSAAVSRRLASKWPKPVWHAPWKCYRVISGHLG